MSPSSAGPDLAALVAVVGPTASGKSALALDIAERFHGEIVNFDSVQLYRGFNIGTAKTPLEQRRGIPHHLLDIIEPNETCTAGDYAQRGRAVLAEIRSRGRLPVLAGGTGFYLRALLEGLFQGPPRDEALRRRLDSRVESRPPGHLHRLLRRLDAASAERIHPNDAPKLIRAIEVSLLARAPISELWHQGRDRLEGYSVIRIGLDPPRDQLYQRIQQRTAQMFSNGLVDEVQSLLAAGVPRSARPFGSLGYSQALDELDGKLTREQAIESTAKRTRRYAKRQMTWFRREPDVHWFTAFGDHNTVQSEANSLLASLPLPPTQHP
ncbi:MAG: tRNA (adenosine(37)-N6)-dimethylallyltransferase MiaA [Acidobacteria bacterium]|nr:tRNA (adenosine(37)-N6)-dimethylallyltransferase MiaA [Acidobacteriota bacterium]